MRKGNVKKKKIAQGIEKCIGADTSQTIEFQVHDTDHKVWCTECIIKVRTGCALYNSLTVAMRSEKSIGYPQRAKITKGGKQGVCGFVLFNDAVNY